jgi:hypothetical protein
MNRSLRVLRFLKLYSEKYPSLVQYYGGYVSYRTWFESIIPDLIQLGKRLSKVRHKKTKNKKARRCMHVCYCIMLWMMMSYSSILKTNGVICFDQMVQRLYGFDPEMALLLRNIVFDIVLDQRFKDLVPLSGRASLWIFFGKETVSSFSFPKNLSFYLKDETFFQYIIFAKLNPRKRLLTTSGWIKLLIRKFGIQTIVQRRKPDDYRKLVFKI